MLRHVGVFCVLIALALAAPWVLPISFATEPLLVGAVLIFAAYLGVSLALARRKAQADE